MANVLHPTGTPAKVIQRTSMWGPTADKIDGAFCEDGKRRMVKITGQPTTFFTVPARVTYKGVTVTGEACSSTNEAGSPDYVFYARGKHKDIFLS